MGGYKQRSINMTVKVPDGWHEVSISTFQELINAGDNVIERVAILTDQDPEDIRRWDLNSFKRVSDALEWTNILPEQKDWKRNITVNGKEYQFIEKLSSLTAGQWLDLEHWVLDSSNNLHKIIALFYEGDAEEFKSVSMADAYGCMVFFSSIVNKSLESMQDYLVKEIVTKEMKKIHSLGSGSFTRWLKGVRLKCLTYLN
jgi:hypothetical protein